MRIVVDTNVLFSGFISRESYTANVIDSWIAKNFEPTVSSEIIQEYCEVMVRDKFSALGTTEERLNLIHMMLSFEHVVLVDPKEKICLIEDDPKDNIFIECALAGECKFIVSGDHHLLKLKEYKDIKIVIAKEFINTLQLRGR